MRCRKTITLGPAAKISRLISVGILQNESRLGNSHLGGCPKEVRLSVSESVVHQISRLNLAIKCGQKCRLALSTASDGSDLRVGG
jgi:hypothetical protein